jgi:putative transposase
MDLFSPFNFLVNVISKNYPEGICIMAEKFANRYRVPSARAAWWNYGWPGAYFITICTLYRKHYFGYISKKKMVLSPVGELAQRFWYEIPHHAHGIELGAFQVMPNHIHGILILGFNANYGNFNGNSVVDDDSTQNNDGSGAVADVPVVVETRHALSLPESEPETGPVPEPKPQYHPRFRNPGPNTISSIIGGYKSVITNKTHQSRMEFDWQDRFYDRIIRNDKEYQRINDYIENNPKNWREDNFY